MTAKLFVVVRGRPMKSNQSSVGFSGGIRLGSLVPALIVVLGLAFLTWLLYLREYKTQKRRASGIHEWDIVLLHSRLRKPCEDRWILIVYTSDASFR